MSLLQLVIYFLVMSIGIIIGRVSMAFQYAVGKPKKKEKEHFEEQFKA